MNFETQLVVLTSCIMRGSQIKPFPLSADANRYFGKINLYSQTGSSQGWGTDVEDLSFDFVIVRGHVVKAGQYPFGDGPELFKY